MSYNDIYSKLPDFDHPPQRVVSLTPSMTESIFDVGAGKYLVGITELCQVPLELQDDLTRIGGPKTLRVQSVIDLEPDLVIADREQNRSEDLTTMEESGLKVWVILPKTVEELINILWELVKLFRVEVVGSPRITTLEKTIEWTKLAAYDLVAVRVFCPIGGGKSGSEIIWRTFNRETYAHDLISRCGGYNIFADHVGQTPVDLEPLSEGDWYLGENETRFPWVTPNDVIALSPDVILLPTEVLSSGEVQEARMMDLLSNTPAVHLGRVHQINGSLITWHGTRIAKAFAELPIFLQPNE
jgi:ABC-type hemin transport system substrate-binding protein